MVEAAVTSLDAPVSRVQDGATNQRIVELRVELPNFDRTVDERGNEVVFYMVHVSLGRRKWSMAKRYNHFGELDTSLKVKYANLPKLPAKTYFKLKTDEQIEGRRVHLHNYLQDIVNRPDMRTNSAFRSFLEIDQQLPESVTYQPVKVAEIVDLNLGARDFCYVESRGLLFVAMSEMNIGSRLDSYITNFSMPWEKKKQKNASNNDQVYSTVGAVACYKMKLSKGDMGSIDGWAFTQMWAKSFALQTGSMYWDDENTTLFIGFDQGRMVRIKVNEQNPMQHHELEELGVHTLRMTGIYPSEGAAGIFASVSDDGSFKVTSKSEGQTISDVKPSQAPLKQILPFKLRNVVAISDAKGNLHLYSKAGAPPEHIVSIQVDSKSEIKGLALSQSEHFIVAGCQDGTITVFDLMASGKERLIKPIVSLQGKKGVRCLQWREKPRREIIAGHVDGLVTVWDYKQQSPIFVLQAHTSAITAMNWDEDKQVLMTCAKDKSFKIWQFPLIWVDEQSVDLQRAPEASAVAKAKSAKSAQKTKMGAAQQSDDSEDSEDDDDDGLGRIKTKPKKGAALPAGLGSMFKRKNQQPDSDEDDEEEKEQPTGAKVDISKGLHGKALQKKAANKDSDEEDEEDEEESKEESDDADRSEPSKTKEEKSAVSAAITNAAEESDSEDSDDLGGWNT